VLLVCAGLFLKGLALSEKVDVGFDSRHVFMVLTELGAGTNDDPSLQ
jgi:hypothetical protein